MAPSDISKQLSRRSLLKTGLMGVAVVAASGVALALQPSRARKAPHLRVFNEKEYSVLAAVADRCCPAAGPGAPGASALDVAGMADSLLAGASDDAQKGVKLALNVFESGLAGALFLERVRPFTQLSGEEQDRVLAGWRDSQVGFRRTVFHALNSMCGALYYGDERTWKRMGYAAPDPQALRAAYAENLVDLHALRATKPEGDADMPIYTGADIKQDTTLKCDVCIVGSGAGGAHVAQRLASKGKHVIVLEEGSFHTSDSFDMREAHMFPRLYQEGGGRATADQSMQIMQGRAVGGTTVVNWTTCFRTPQRVFEHWHEHHGVKGISHEALVPHWERIEKRLNVTQMKLEQVNKNNMVTWNGAKKLGWNADLLHRNVKNCAHTGYCGMGCPIDAKQSMLLTMIPEAVRAGADIYANAWVERVVKVDRRCKQVIAYMRDPKTDKMNGIKLTVEAKLTVLSGGGINTPAILLRSNVNANGLAGMRTFLHPAIPAVGVHEERIDPFVGSPQYVHSDQFVDRGPDKIGMLIEGAPIFPFGTGGYFPAFGAEKQAIMDLLPHLSMTGVLLHDGFDLHEPNDGAHVTVGTSGLPRVDYHWTERLREGLREATRNAMLIQLAGGAKQVISGHPHYARTVDEVNRVVDSAAFGPCQLPVFVAHVMGGCAMGTDEAKSVVDSRSMRHHGFDDLFVIDGSVFPTATTVNPQISIYGLASWASEHVLEAAA